MIIRCADTGSVPPALGVIVKAAASEAGIAGKPNIHYALSNEAALYFQYVEYNISSVRH